MPDEIDLANDQAERWLQQSLAATRTGTRALAPKGNCHYCEAEFEAADPDRAKKLYCDSECAADHAEELRLKARR